jgi:hypothetical protein
LEDRKKAERGNVNKVKKEEELNLMSKVEIKMKENMK